MKTVRSHWIAEVPSGWRIDTPRFAFSVRGDRAKPGMEQMTASQQYGVIPQSEYIKKTGSRVVVVEKDFSILKAVYPGDFVIHMRSFQGGLELSEVQGCTSSAYVMLIPGPQIHSARYYRWVFKCDGYINELRSTSNLVRDGQAMRWANFIQVPIPFPPPEVQDSIAQYLDRETERIEELRDSIRAQIDALEAYKRSLIAEALYGGLDESAELVDPGVGWVRHTPAHWNVVRAKYMFTQRSTRGNSRNLELLSPTQKYGVIPQALYEQRTGATAVKLSEDANLEALKTIHVGDFCISLRSFQGGFAYSDYEGVVSPAYQVFYATCEIDSGYFKYLFKDSSFIAKMNSYTMSLRDGRNIAFSDFGATYIPVPPIEEQSEIAGFLDKKTGEIDSVVSTKLQQLDLLSNYKKSLVYEMVTGKQEVPVR